MATPGTIPSFDNFVAGLTRPFGIVEDWLSFFFANLLTLSLGGLLEYFNEDAWRGGSVPAKVLLTLAAVLWLMLDPTYLWRLWQNTFRGRRHPLFASAAQARMWPTLLRPIVGLWWLVHFAFGVLAVIGFNRISKGGHESGPVLTFFLATCSGFAANGYLALAVASVTRSDKVRQGVWQFRGLLDISLGVLGWLLSR